MNITIIHYRANGYDTCRGCLMGSSDSDFSIYVAECEDDAASSIAYKLEEDSKSDREFCGWDSTILLDGLEEYDEGYDDELQHSIKVKAQKMFDDKVEREKEVARQQKAKEKEQAALDKIERKKEKVRKEIKKLAELKAKYEE